MIHIQRNSDGSFRTNHASHTADLFCDRCGVSASGVDMNANATYVDSDGVHVSISFECSELGGSCHSTTCWPLTDGTDEAQELALVKTA